MKDKYIAEYMRISDDDSDIGKKKQESDSIGNQRKVLEYYIHHNRELSGYPIREFSDDGYSGVNFNRPGIQTLLREVQKNRVSCIVVKDLSRLGRNYIEVGDYIEQIFPFFGVRFISVSDHFDSFADSAGIEIGFKNLMHELYSRDLSRKVKSVKSMQQERGAYTGGDMPYGYQKDYQPDEAAAEIVREIFLLAAEGNTTGKIAENLNKRAVLTPGAYKNQAGKGNYELKNKKSNLWTPEQVREIIRNEVYTGTHICHKTSSVKPGITRKNDKSEYIRFENNHEVLVKKDIFEAAQKSIPVKGKRGKYRKAEDIHVLKGKMKCGYCGYSMNQHGKTGKFHYDCRMGASCGSHTRIDAKSAEKAVVSILQQFSEKHDISELTKNLMDELVERIDVYGADRIEITWKFREESF